jgi:hypothetical protein
LRDATEVDDFGNPIPPERFTEALKPLVTAISGTVAAFPRKPAADCEDENAEHRA